MTNPFLESVSLEAYLGSVTLDPCLEFFLPFSGVQKNPQNKTDADQTL